jgi:hypothetical protein
VATCGNNDARITDDGGKQKFLWKTGLMQFWKVTFLSIINIFARFIQVSLLTFFRIGLKCIHVWGYNWSWNYALNVSYYSEKLKKWIYCLRMFLFSYCHTFSSYGPLAISPKTNCKRSAVKKKFLLSKEMYCYTFLKFTFMLIINERPYGLKYCKNFW